MKLYKYHGAGNDFLIKDNRSDCIDLSIEEIYHLCHRHFGIGADGLMLLNKGDEECAFTMEFFNPDGSGGMMCGNGGRCIVAFAHDMGIRNYIFRAADGLHEAIIHGDGLEKTVELKMCDVTEILKLEANDYFLDTGTRHFVRFVDDPNKIVIDETAKLIRNNEKFAPVGTNVNIAMLCEDGVVRMCTFEKGVEGETLACGTGIVATALAAKVHYGIKDDEIQVNTKGGEFNVRFQANGEGFSDIWLVGPTTYVAEINVP